MSRAQPQTTLDMDEDITSCIAYHLLANDASVKAKFRVDFRLKHT